LEDGYEQRRGSNTPEMTIAVTQQREKPRKRTRCEGF